MCKFAMTILRDFDAAKDVSQSTIFKMWKSRESIKTDQSIKAYLIKAVKNNSLNYLRSTGKASDREALYEDSKDGPQTPDYFAKSELLAVVNKVLDGESEERSEIFRLRKFGGYSTKEVAEKLNINEKKVHYNMGVIMEKMAEVLKNYLTLAMIFFVELF